MKNKKIVSLFIIVLCVFLVGCGSKDKKESKDESDGWVVDITSNSQMIEEDILNIFNDANKDGKYRMVELLGKQVVAGTNYMFLCTEDKEYKVVVVYNDLENNSSITKATTFDFKQYVDKNNDIDVEELVGGWTIEVPAKPIELSENVQAIFDKANENMVGATYYPISQVAHQNKDGKNYAILCFGRLSDQNSTTGVFLLTIKEDENGADTIVSISHVDLKKYNS